MSKLTNINSLSNHDNFIQDKWLSKILKKQSYKLSSPSNKLLLSDFPEGFDFVSTRVPVTEINTVAHLEEIGFKLVGTNLQFSIDQLIISGVSLDQIRFAQAQDKSAVEKLAFNSFSHDRFHCDPLIGNQFASEIKQHWVNNYFSGKRGKYLVVAEIDSKISGFLLLLENSATSLVIDLIAVDRSKRRNGIAKKMIFYLVKTCMKENLTLQVGTQISNVDSIALYQSLGFHIMSSYYDLHYHNKF